MKGKKHKHLKKNIDLHNHVIYVEKIIRKKSHVLEDGASRYIEYVIISNFF